MWKKLGLAAAMVVVAGWLSTSVAEDPAPTQLPAEMAPANPAAPVVPGGAADGEAPRRAAKEFATWIEAVIQEKFNVASRQFPMSRQVQEYTRLEQVQRIFRKFPKLSGLQLALIGGRELGDQTGVLLFTVTSENGPVAFKIYHYKFGDTRTVGRMEVTDDWMEIERMYTTVDALAAPVLVPL